MSQTVSRTMSRVARAGGVLAAGTIALVATALPAWAHVSVAPTSAPAGGYTTLAFKVPTESDTASTTKLDVAFPTDAPIGSVSVQPKAGWTYEVHKGKPPKPVVTDDGDQINEVVTEIIWTAAGSPGIKPGEFDTFVVSAGPLPEGVASISFKALQTYSDGEVVRWIETSTAGQPEPEHPAPTLTLTKASADDADDGATTAATPVAAASSESSGSLSDGTARGLGIAGLVVGVLGLAAAGFALATSRRRAGTGG